MITKPYRDKKYLAWIRKQPCVICRRTPSQAHHEALGNRGIGTKAPDTYTLPLCYMCHRNRENTGFETFWEHEKDPKLQIIEHLTRYIEYWKRGD